MDTVLSWLTLQAAHATHADGAVLYDVRSGDTCQPLVAAGILSKSLDTLPTQRATRGVLGKLRKSQGLLRAGTRRQLCLPAQLADQLAIRSELLLPVRDSDGALLAVLCLVSRAPDAIVAPDDGTLAALLASLVQTLRASELDAVSGFDPLASSNREARARSGLASESVERRLARSEHNLRLLLDAVADGIVINRGGRFLYANQAAAKIFGARTPAELLQHSLFELIASSEHPRLRADMQRAEAGEVVLAQRSARRLNGETFTIEGRIRCIDYDNGAALVVLCRDVTEIRALEERSQLSDRLRAAGTLAAAIAHEISNPLTAVLGNLELMNRVIDALTALLPVEQTQLLRAIAQDAISGAERISRIVRAMRTLVRDTSRVSRTPVALEVAIDAALNLTQNKLSQRANVVRQLRPTPLVAADETRLTQVLVNLLTNAGQAIESGRPDQHNICVCSYTTLSGQAVVEVRDDGVGIAADQLKHVFEPFYTTKDVGSGTGLGLAIVHRIVSDLGGEISVTSKPGLGTTFRVQLPAAELAAEGAASVSTGSVRPSAAPVPAAERVVSASHSQCVLIVDDEPAIVQLVSRMLEGRYQTLVATSGAQALQIIARGGVDLILSDIMMPSMNGAQLYEAIATRYPELQQRVIFMTGGAFTAKTLELLRRVSNPRIEKPMDANELMALLESTLAGSKPSK